MDVMGGDHEMIAEVISIGDELTTGQRVDTNSQWISMRLGELGITTLYHSTVADHPQAQLDVFRTAAERANLIVTTGGLGPTADDLTRQVLAELSGSELVLDQESLDHIRNIFESRGRKMPESNTIQAMFPQGSSIIDNPFGTAPGIDFPFKTKNQAIARFFCLPGVPAEMTQMWELHVRDAIESMQGSRAVIRHHRVHCFGRGESDIEKMVGDLIHRGNDPQVGITASKATISFRIVASGKSESDCNVKIEQTESFIREKLGDLVFGVGDVELQDIVVEQLRSKNQKIAIVDCATDQLLVRLLKSANPEHDVFENGFAFTSLSAAETFFGRLPSMAPSVQPQSVNENKNPLSSVANRLAELSGATCVLVAGEPKSSSDPKTRECQIGILTPTGFESETVPLIGHPSIKEIRFCKFVFNQLRLRLQRES